MAEVWKTMKKMNGVISQHSFPSMKTNDQTYDTNAEKAQLFVETFASLLHGIGV